MTFYKYYAGLTSQVGFCSTPLRLDSYNRCQFSCSYCFASTRQGFGRNENFKVGNPASLKKRLERVSKGNIASALDELISNRVPFQLGGMSDPFTKHEEKSKVTLEYLKTLNKFKYPIIVSTKSDLIASDEYLDVISESNIYVRFSTTIVDPSIREKIDLGCPSISRISKASKVLADIGIPTSFRFQPIIPGHEASYKKILNIAKACGVKHISAEYLKVPIDANKKFSTSLIHALEGNPISYYRNRGALQFGREYVLPLSMRRTGLVGMAKEARKSGMTFGFADNDLLLHADGNACCAASNLYLKDASFFNANIVALAKPKAIGELISFDEYLTSWIPKQAISTYLNSTARIDVRDLDGPEWLHYLKSMWTGNLGIYTPDFFDGIEKTSQNDKNGLPIYIRKKSEFERFYEETK